jgi:DNA-binding SARP family transcriptional activator/tetratricopeptide (TPR) repeat protein
VRFLVLGPVEVRPADGRVFTMPRRHERCLLAILLLQPGRPVSTERLCDLLWDEDPPPQARASVYTYVARIRSGLARAGVPDAVESTRGGYRVAVDPDDVDAHRFRSLFDAATRTTDLTERDRLLRDALDLWRGPTLQHAASHRLRDRLCADLEELRHRAVEESLATGLDLGRHQELLPQLARLNADEPVRERLVELHMAALYRQGRSAEALDVYRQARTRLAEELGLEPGPALRELQGVILRGEQLPGPEAPALTGYRIRPAHLPPDLRTFAGRTQHLRRLDALLDQGNGTVVISAITGTAGVGKTSLAVHWAHRIADRFPDGQLHVNLRGFDPHGTAMSPSEALGTFLEAFDIPPQRIPDSLTARVGLYRSLLAGRRILVLLDNAASAEQVRPLLPGAAGCLALVTSRNQLDGLIAGESAQPLTVELLTDPEAYELLTRRLGAARVAAEPQAVAEIVERCTRLPLALAIVAARAATRPTVSLATLARELADASGSLDPFAGSDAATDVRAVFSWSYRTLSAPAARLFRLLSLHPGPDLTAPALASLAGLPPDRVAPLVTELVHGHLLTETTRGRYTTHDLLRAYAGECAAAQTPAERESALYRMADHYLHTARTADRSVNPYRDPIDIAPPEPGTTPEDPVDAMTWFESEHRVLLAVLGEADRLGMDRKAWQLAWALGTFLDRRGRWHDWESASRLALAAAERGNDPRGRAHAHRDLGGALAWLARYEDAHKHFQSALIGFTDLDDRAGQALTHTNISWLYGLEKHHQDAFDHAEAALRRYRSVAHRPGTATALSSLAWCHCHLGRYEQGHEYSAQSLALQQELGDRRGQAFSWGINGYAHEHLGDLRQAIRCYESALSLLRECGERYYEAWCLADIGDAYHALGEDDAAVRAWRPALALFEQLHHPDAEEVRANLKVHHYPV